MQTWSVQFLAGHYYVAYDVYMMYEYKVTGDADLVAKPWKPFFAATSVEQNLETPPSARRKSMKFFDPGKKNTSFSETCWQ